MEGIFLSVTSSCTTSLTRSSDSHQNAWGVQLRFHDLSDTNYSIYMITQTYIMCCAFSYYSNQMIKKNFGQRFWSSPDTKAAQQSNYWTLPTLVNDSWYRDHRRQGRQRRQAETCVWCYIEMEDVDMRMRY